MALQLDLDLSVDGRFANDETQLVFETIMEIPLFHKMFAKERNPTKFKNGWYLLALDDEEKAAVDRINFEQIIDALEKSEVR